MASRATVSKTVESVLFESGNFFSRCMKTSEDNMKKIVPVMIERKLISKKLGKYCVKSNDSDLLLADMKKNMTLDDFFEYLVILTEFGSQEGYDGEIRKLMRIMKGSLGAIKPEPNSKHATIIDQFIAVAFHQSTPSVHAQSQDPALTETVKDSQSQPPPGQFENISNSFTSEGGVLYSPVHGVTVIVPPNAIPAGVRLDLSVYFYSGHSCAFTKKEGMNICSVIVWFHHCPSFGFLEDVTVEIPHAASADPTSLHVLTWGEDKQGPPYKLDTEVPADFSDGYHAVFKVKHFSPFVVAKTRYNYTDEILHKTKVSASKKDSSLKSLKKMNSDSIEKCVEEGLIVLVGHSSSTESTSKPTIHRQDAVDTADSPVTPEPCVRDSGIRYSIACSMPQDRSGAEWMVNFAVCYNHPSANWLVKKYGEQLHGPGCTVRHRSFHTNGDYLELCPLSNSSWSVFALKTSVQNIEDVSCSSPKREFEEPISAQFYSPSVTYSVRSSSPPPNTTFECKIDVTGALDSNEKPFSFELTSSSPAPQLQFKVQVLYICSYLYGDKDFLETIISPSDDITLNTDIPDHIKFLTEISFQLSNSTILSHALEIPQLTLDQITMECQCIGDVCFSSYKLLTDWVSRKGRDAKLSSLRSALCKMGIKAIEKYSNPEDLKDILITPEFDRFSLFPNISSEEPTEVSAEKKFVLKLSSKLSCCWRRVGSLMGITLTELHEIDIAAASDISYAREYNMLLKLQKMKGRETTLGTLFRALKCAFYYTPSYTNHAYWYATREAEKRLK